LDIEKIECEMHVKISNDISKTHNLHNSCDTMHNMKGKVYKVEDVRSGSVVINGFTWDPDDIIEIKPKKKYKEPFHFDTALI